jgi:putative addiction module killer protein
VPRQRASLSCRSRRTDEGLSELRLFFDPGYRVYFGEDAGNIVVILCGGEKSSQDSDIENAKAYWQEYKTHAEDENP